MDFNNVAVVMIARNEEKAVAEVIRRIKFYAPGAEIIIVDSSDDNTSQIALKNGAKVIRQFPPKGYGPAMEKALLASAREIIITMDCDGSYPAQMIPQLAAKIAAGYDIVSGSRLSFGKPRYMPWINYLANKFFNRFASLVFLTRIDDIHTGMRAYKRELLHQIQWGSRGYMIPGLHKLKSGLKGNAFPVELLLKPMSLGFKCAEIPIRYNERLGSSKLERLNSALWTVLRIINARLTRYNGFHKRTEK